jgi:hypothetical protein
MDPELGLWRLMATSADWRKEASLNRFPPEHEERRVICEDEDNVDLDLECKTQATDNGPTHVIRSFRPTETLGRAAES